MPLNPDFVGRTYAAAGTYQVGREKVREFAAGIGDANPVSTDVDAARALGYSDIDRKSTRLNSSHSQQSRMPSSA